MSEKFMFDESIVEELTSEEKAELEKQLDNPEMQKAMKALEDVFAQEDMSKWLAGVQSAEDLHAGLSERGIDMDIDVCQLLYNEVKSSQQDELSAEDLDEVAGGGSLLLGALVVIGGFLIAGIGAYCAYKWIKEHIRSIG